MRKNKSLIKLSICGGIALAVCLLWLAIKLPASQLFALVCVVCAFVCLIATAIASKRNMHDKSVCISLVLVYLGIALLVNSLDSTIMYQLCGIALAIFGIAGLLHEFKVSVTTTTKKR